MSAQNRLNQEIQQVNDYFDQKNSMTTPFLKGSGRESPSPYNKNAQFNGGLATIKLPTPKRDMDAASHYSRPIEIDGEGSRADSFYDRVGVGPLYKRKQIETPHSELKNYLNWVPQKDKANFPPQGISGATTPMIQKKTSSNQLPATLTPVRPQRNEDERSKTVLKVREKYTNRSVVDQVRANIAIDGYSIRSDQADLKELFSIKQNLDGVKARAKSQLKTFDIHVRALSQQPSKIELNSLLSKKPSSLGTKTPLQKRGILSEMAWEDQQRIMGFSLAHINRLKRDDLLKAVNLPEGSPSLSKTQRTFDQYQAVEEALKKIARAGDDFVTMRDYARALIKRFDHNNDGVITFQELCQGLKSFDIDLGLKERLALMRKLDVDKDGSITDLELGRALNTVEVQMRNEAVTTCLRKIASGSEEYSSMRAYIKDLMKKFDTNSDGLLSIQELIDGLKKLNIFLTQREKQCLISRLDLNRDGEISEGELLRLLNQVGTIPLSKHYVQNSIEQVLKQLADASKDFSSLKDYCKYLIRRFDTDSDGIITFIEFCEGLSLLNIQISNQEKKALMRKLDIDRDGQITEIELYRALSNVDSLNLKGQKEHLTKAQVEQTLRKIASGAEDSEDLRKYAKRLVQKFDSDRDGIISFKELCQGLKTINIYLTTDEREALLKKLDINQDGQISDQELYDALKTVNLQDIQQSAKEAADIALKKLASGAESYDSMASYVNFLMKQFDKDGDGIITLSELSDGVKRLNIHLSVKEQQALMKKMDLDANGRISKNELFKVLSQVDTQLSKSQLNQQVDHALRKIASGAEEYPNMREYIRVIMHAFDSNSDGYLSYDELIAGLKRFLKISLTSQEQSALMKRFDFNQDGEISESELYKVLAQYDVSGGNGSSAGFGSRSLSPGKISLAQKDRQRLSIYEIVEKIKKVASKYQSLKHYVTSMMSKYDVDGDGYITFQELSNGLDHDDIRLTKQEKLALMKHLDEDCDGEVSREEIFNALLVDPRHQRSHHFSKVNVDHLLKRIRQGAEKFKSLEEFCRYIFNKMDTDGSGTLSFNELSVGLIDMGIEISNKEKHELMKRFDDDADGEIAFEEFYRGLSMVKQFSQPNELNTSHQINIDHAIIKIAKGAEQYKCIEDYIIMLFNKFDINKDGAVSFKELREGLMSMNVHLADNEMHALFHKLDTDRDGSITQEELFNAILTKEKYTKNPNILQSKVNTDHVLRLIRKGVEKYSSLQEYVDVLASKFDLDGDGLISFDELADGLKSINVKISDKEKLALMRELDGDRNGFISKQEIYNALSQEKFGGEEIKPSKTLMSRSNQGIEQIMAQIRKAVQHYKSQQEQIIGLMKIFDNDNDGMISFLELVEGVKSLGISAKKTDMIDLMNKIDVDRDGFITQKELYRGLGLKAAHEGYQGTQASIEVVLAKLNKGAEKYSSLQEYVSQLFRMFATAGSEFMTFQELMNCLKTFNFNLTQPEKLALMKHIDENGDNQLSKEEFLVALQQAGNTSQAHNGNGGASPTRMRKGEGEDERRVDQALIKIKQGAARFKSLQEYCQDLIRKIDKNKDGMISFLELSDGLREIGIKIFKGEQAAMMRRLDEDRDGLITYDDLYRGLKQVQ